MSRGQYVGLCQMVLYGGTLAARALKQKQPNEIRETLRRLVKISKHFNRFETLLPWKGDGDIHVPLMKACLMNESHHHILEMAQHGPAWGAKRQLQWDYLAAAKVETVAALRQVVAIDPVVPDAIVPVRTKSPQGMAMAA